MKACATIVWLLALLIPVCRTSSGQSVSGVINTYYQVTAINTSSNTVTVSSASGLSAGQRVVIYQAKGTTYNIGSSSTFGDISAINLAGAYEFNTICTINGNDVLLRDKFVNTYNASGQVQLVTMPSYSSVTISGAVTGASWNPATGTGGIVALEASGTITLSADIDVSAQGFQGGALVNWPSPNYDCSPLETYNAYYYNAPASGNFTGGKKGEGVGAYTTGEEYGRGKMVNGGGGGNNANAGGGGGGNYGAGGAGGKRVVSGFNCPGSYPGIGGLSLSTYGYSSGSNRIYFGGGGGEGHENNGVGTPGGNGGGIIFLSATTIAGLGGRLLADGGIGVNSANIHDTTQAQGDGGGGGGAGGAIILNASSVTGAITAEAKGGKGSDAADQVNDCSGPGGGGGGGTIWAAGASFPAAVTTTVTGGANGVVSLTNKNSACSGLPQGAASGANGAAVSGYVAPVSAGTTCTVLALADLKYFKADASGADVVLSWELSSPDMSAAVRNFVIQRSVDASRFINIASLSAVQDSSLYGYTDAGADMGSTLYYRLAWQYNDGSWSYSRIVAVSMGPAPATFSFQLQPNPALQHMTLTVFSIEDGNASVAIASAQGQLIQSFRIALHRGANTIPVDLRTLAPATYFLIVEEGGRRIVKPFIKKGA